MKLTEKMLYETWLDIYYADKLSQNTLSDLLDEVNIFRKQSKKIKKLLKDAAEKYEKIYGRVPNMK